MARVKEMKYKEVTEKSFKIVDTKRKDSSQGQISISRSISNVNNTKTFAVICSAMLLAALAVVESCHSTTIQSEPQVLELEGDLRVS